MNAPYNDFEGKDIRQAIYLLNTAYKATYASEIDRKMIFGILGNIPPEISKKPYQIDAEEGMTAEAFKQWLTSDYTIGDVVRFRPIDIPDADFEFGMIADKPHTSTRRPQISPTIVLKVSDDQLINCNIETRNMEVLRATEDETTRFHHILMKNSLRFDYNRMGIVKNRLPKPDDIVRFHNGIQRGVGIVRKIMKAEDGTASVDLHCYLLFPNSPNSTQRAAEELGYTYPAQRTFKTTEWLFESLPKIYGDDGEKEITEEEQPDKNISLSHHRSVIRKLNEALEKVGKRWNGFQKRVEPLELPYSPDQWRKQRWYVNSKFEVKSYIENNSPVSQERRRVGNNFATEDEVKAYRDFLVDCTKQFLSRPKAGVGKKD